MLANILVAVDGSSHAKKALDLAVGLAKTMGSHITIIYVVHARIYLAVQEAGVNTAIQNLIEDLKEYGKKVLEEAKVTAQEAGVQVDTLLVRGFPAEEILKKSEAGKYDMIVIGSRGRTSAKALLLGSISDSVSHHAKCPVLIVK